MSIKSFIFTVSGRVQGVWYRANVQKNAQEEGFNGYIKNLDDGRVEAGVSCEEEVLETFIALLKKGSPLSYVEEIEQGGAAELFSGGFVVR